VKPGRRRWYPRARARLRKWSRRLVYFAGPFVVTGLLLWLVWQLFSGRAANELLIISALSFFWFGTTVVLTPAVLPTEITLGTWELALWMIYLNTAAAFLYAYNLDLLEKLPAIGPYLRRARANAAKTLEEHRWIKRLAAFGVGAFVLTPLPGSGQLGGCFVGRVVGLPRRTIFLVVTLAGTLVCVLYASFGSYIKAVLDDHQISTWIRVIGAVLVIAAAWFIFKMLRYLGRDPDKVAAAEARRQRERIELSASGGLMDAPPMLDDDGDEITTGS
jgi:hypothetical protein